MTSKSYELAQKIQKLEDRQAELYDDDGEIPQHNIAKWQELENRIIATRAAMHQAWHEEETAYWKDADDKYGPIEWP